MTSKRQRLLHFLPAVLTGLLAGWLFSRVLRHPEDKSLPVSGPVAGITTVPVPDGSGGTRSLWQNMLEARDLPPISKDFQALARGLEKLSPARRDLTVELTRSTLSGNEISANSLGFPFSGGDAGFAETCARLARTEPGRALFQIDTAAEAFKGRWSSDTLDRARRLVIREWLRKNPEEALEKIAGKDHPPSFQRGQRLQMLIYEWAALDPSAAAAALPGLPENGPGFDRLSLASALLQTWQAKDPAAARQWAETQADPAWRESLMRSADEFAATEPAAKASLLLAAPQRDSAKLAATFGQWLSSDAGSALGKLATLPASDPFWSGDAANAAQRWAMEAHLAANAPASSSSADSGNGSRSASGEDKTASFLDSLQTIPAGPRRDALLQGLADFGASNDIPFALGILTELHEGPARVQAVSTLTELWMRQDPVRASEWLASLPPESESRQAGVARLAENLAPDDPERAAQWADTLPGNYPRKNAVLQTILTSWRAKDPAAADAWHRNQ